MIQGLEVEIGSEVLFSRCYTSKRGVPDNVIEEKE